MSDTIRIACMGDTMPGGILHYESGDSFCSDELLDVLRKADVRVATLETAIGDSPDFDPEKMKRDKDVIYSPTADLHRITTLGINVVSLANNHAWDLGYDGIRHTMRELDRLGIKYCGVGGDLEEARRPAVISINGKSVAFIAFCDSKPGTCGYIPIASKSTPGINVMDAENIRDCIMGLRGKYDYLFVMMHWGKEYYCYPTAEVNDLARKIIDWGADGVIGSHSHQIQPVISYHGKPIIFSLGNFFFPDRIITSPRSTYYPAESPEIASLPVTNGYPMVDTPTFKIWKPVARRGQVTIISVSDKHTETETTFTRMDSKSHISVSNDSAPLMLRLAHLLVKLPAYRLIFTGMRGCRFIRKKIKGEL